MLYVDHVNSVTQQTNLTRDKAKDKAMHMYI